MNRKYNYDLNEKIKHYNVIANLLHSDGSPVWKVKTSRSYKQRKENVPTFTYLYTSNNHLPSFNVW